VADNSHNVYYIKGFNYKGKNIYSIKIWGELQNE
jgi:hypothetical protein